MKSVLPRQQIEWRWRSQPIAIQFSCTARLRPWMIKQSNNDENFHRDALVNGEWKTKVTSYVLARITIVTLDRLGILVYFAIMVWIDRMKAQIIVWCINSRITTSVIWITMSKRTRIHIHHFSNIVETKSSSHVNVINCKKIVENKRLWHYGKDKDLVSSFVCCSLNIAKRKTMNLEVTPTQMGVYNNPLPSASALPICTA